MSEERMLDRIALISLTTIAVFESTFFAEHIGWWQSSYGIARAAILTSYLFQIMRALTVALRRRVERKRWAQSPFVQMNEYCPSMIEDWMRRWSGEHAKRSM